MELKQLGEQFHFQVVFLYIPEREEFGMTPQRLKEIESFGSLFPHSLDFRPLILNKPWLWFDSSHPNALGHKIIAEGIFHALKSAQ
jgi:lysophospholipase L1-like esterase